MAGGVLTNPITGERFVRLPAPPDRLRIEVQAPRHMVRPPLHLHCHGAESFQILEGRGTILVDGNERVFREGDTLEVAPGTPHTWWNSGDGLLRFLTEFRPALRMQSFFETLCGLAIEGRKPDVLQVAASAALWDTYLASPPVMVQRALFTVLRPVAWARGYRASYARFDGTFDEPAKASEHSPLQAAG
jgi:mannose-6-phosphate isomerase-like protein (cupin superfamily)